MATSGFEFQRLHGMGEALYAQLSEDRPDIGCRTYAPVGSHRDLLAYLVRRLLENGANSSFVAVAADDAVPVATLLRRPADIIGTAANARHPNIRLPRDLYQPQRQNSRGIEFGERAALSELVAAIAAETTPAAGSIADATPADANAAIAAAREGFKGWSRTPAQRRATMLEHAADLLEQRRAHFIALLQREGGKTLDDALSEVREAVDFCRYYAAEGRKLFGEGEAVARADRREQRAAAARPRRLRGDLAVEFSAGDFSGPGRGGADGRQCGGGKARRTDAADRGGGRAAAASSRRARIGAASGARRRQHRRRAGRASRRRRRGLHRLDRGRAIDQPDAGRQGRRRSCR